ncbi:hypothetical protein EDD11_008881 [Mortierella claussenii]|nr:hypothetical protein EDD11_008881 [Mortierella claussenii]
MAEFSSLVSKFAHKNGDSSSPRSSTGITNNKKRAYASNDVKVEENENGLDETNDAQEGSSNTLTTQVRKSLRLSAVNTPPPLNSRSVSADSIRSKPHHKRVVAGAVKKEDEVVAGAVKKEDEVVAVATPALKNYAAFKTSMLQRVKSRGRNPGYASPAVYAHLSLVPDIIDYDLDVLFVGINPGVRSSERARHFAGPTNHFWPCLSDSGLLPPGVRLGPDDDQSLPAICNMGLTNLVDRPSRMGNELSEAECRAAAPTLTAKIKKYRPRFVCFVSKQAWEMYSGVGLGLQTAWVSWFDEPEDQGLPGVGSGAGDDIGVAGERVIQNNLDAQGYRLAPYFETGPSIDSLETKLEAEGVPSPFKRESTETKDPNIKTELKAEEEEDVKPMKMEIDDKNSVKLEQAKEENQDQEVKVKVDYAAEEAEESARSRANIGGGSGTSGSLQSRFARGREGSRGSRMFVIPSTSGRVTQYRKEDKLAYFKQLAELVRKDRRMRGVKDPWEE